jgi:hypothetical protein
MVRNTAVSSPFVRYDTHTIRADQGASLLSLQLHNWELSPVQEFDVAFYMATYPDIASAMVDPFVTL